MAQETLKFDAEIDKILHLMIHSLYENSEIFLRELISNASDACDKLRYQALTNSKLADEDHELKIALSFDKEKRTITIADNGIGMTRDEMVKNLGTIAKSGTQNFLTKMTGEKKQDVNLIGQFGVGFYSCFMVADKVKVISRKAGKKGAFSWESDGKGKFKIGDVSKDFAGGTEITLYLREGADEYLDKWRLNHIVKTYSEHISFPIELTDEEGNTETVNTASALWLRPKSEISDEQYTEFYHHVGQVGDDPWMTLHNKTEGAVEYSNLLYIPSSRPFDLFHPDRSKRVKLYVKRVYITDENIDIIPSYLRFLRGVVDSEDLPLNISRETLQHNPVVNKIKNLITKKVLSELKQKSEKQPEEYRSFWDNFGPVLKEGLCDGDELRDQLLEICRFSSTSSGEGLVSLKEYKDRMKEGQSAIYYILGDNLEALQKSPQIEGFAKKGIEVLFLCDSVDDFWVNVLNEYDGTQIKSVTRVSDELNAIDEVGEGGDVKTEDKKKSKSNKALDSLVDVFKEVLGDDIKDVRVSTKLTESPVCLAVQDGAMDIRMERFLVENKQLPSKMAKILEINPSHKIIKSLVKDLKAGKDKNKVEDAIFLLYGQASILEGETPADVSGFSKRMNKLLEKALAA